MRCAAVIDSDRTHRIVGQPKQSAAERLDVDHPGKTDVRPRRKAALAGNRSDVRQKNQGGVVQAKHAPCQGMHVKVTVLVTVDHDNAKALGSGRDFRRTSRYDCMEPQARGRIVQPQDIVKVRRARRTEQQKNNVKIVHRLAAPHHFDYRLAMLGILRADQQASIFDGLADPGNTDQLALHAKQQIVSLRLLGDTMQLGNAVLVHFQQDEVSLALSYDGRNASNVGLGQYGPRQGIKRGSADIYF